MNARHWFFILFSAMSLSCNNQKQAAGELSLVTLDPGHFHAALVQKTMYPELGSTVYVYAPDGKELNTHLSLIDQYNSRAENPTRWKEELYRGNDFLDRMIEDRKGNLVVLAGNNRRKTEYIFRSVESGHHVLADKPMAIDPAGFDLLLQSFGKAREKGLVLYDIMTERSEITNRLQRELVADSALFGNLQTGTAEEPAVFIESVHYFSKQVSGKPLIRPEWFFDPKQQGDPVSDVGVHLVDLIQWICFPDQVIDYKKDIVLNHSRSWPTPLTISQFGKVTGATRFPDYLSNDLVGDTVFNAHANGEIGYSIKNVFAKAIARWDYEAAEGGDTHYARIKGDKAEIVIHQRPEENFKPTIYIIPAKNRSRSEFFSTGDQTIRNLQQKYPGVSLERLADSIRIQIPETLKSTHEEHFADVMKRYLQYVREGNMPDWEIPNMITKYYITTRKF